MYPAKKSRAKSVLSIFLVVAFLISCMLVLAPTRVQAAGDDTTPPVVMGVRVLNTVVQRPGILRVEIDVVEEDTGVVDCFVSVIQAEKNDGASAGKSCRGQYSGPAFYTGTIVISVPIPADAPVDDWMVCEVYMVDQAGNMGDVGTYGYGDSPYDYYAYMLLGPPGGWFEILAPHFSVVDEFDLAFTAALSNPNLVSRLKSMAEGQAARIMIDESSKGILPKAAFDAIKGRDKTIVAYTSGQQWIFRGKDITKPTKDVDLNFTIQQKDGTDYGSSRKVISIQFAPNGQLPGRASIRLKSDYLYNLHGYTGKLLLYHLENNKLTEEKGNFDLAMNGTDKWCYFDVTHNSEFIVSGTKLAAKVKVAAKKVSFGNNKTKSLKIKKKLKLMPNVKPANTTDKLRFTSSKPGIAKVNNKGVVTANSKSGKTKITAIAGTKRASCIVYVYSPKVKYKVTAKPSDAKKGNVVGGGRFKGGVKKTLVAKPKRGYKFVGWYENDVKISSKKKYTHKVTRDTTFTAKFKKK